MIAYLKGQIKVKHKNYLIIEVANIGYQVFVNQSLFAEFTAGQAVELYTHQHIKEDALDLYGFKNLEELEMFELLVSISGVGPKSALGILSVAKTEELKVTIARGDSSILTKVSGIGRKIAERIVLELRDKVVSIGTGETIAGGGTAAGLMQSDEIDALLALGYSLQQAREALREVEPSLKNPSERIRAALKMLGK